MGKAKEVNGSYSGKCTGNCAPKTRVMRCTENCA
jgi:hypothetical protein